LLSLLGDGTNYAPMIFVLSVFMTARFTNGYVYGIVMSLVDVLLVNYVFTYPYFTFNFTLAGYPITIISSLAVSLATSALTSRAKQSEKIRMEADREKTRSNLLRAVSHDLRTPLTTISGSASVLMSSTEISSQNVQMVQDIKNEADALIIMVENLLSVTRIQDGHLPLTKREEMLEEVAGDAVLTTRRRFPNRSVEMEPGEDILYFPMEPMLIKQVIINLLENAARHSGNSEPITLKLYRRDEWAVTEVCDRGRGLPQEVIQAVKESRPISRDISGDSTRGMGIGLSVCGSIIKAHNGFFEAENSPDGGAVFRFGLPLSEEYTEEI
jgi:two-component system sensor histidine kinase KdpD